MFTFYHRLVSIMLASLSITLTTSTSNFQATNFFQIAVVGAGPAGITTVAVLLEHGVNPKDILWIDPEFKVGRLGKYYGNVPSNQKACRITEFLNKCMIFKEFKAPSIDAVKNYNQQQEPLLQLLVDPLQDITNNLLTQVSAYYNTVKSINKINATESTSWAVSLSDTIMYAQKVILAVGAHPKKFSHAEFPEIPLDIALDTRKLKSLVKPNKPVIVIGSAHSALLIVKYLCELAVNKIINIYTKAPSYGSDGGLEGVTARWAQEVLEKNPPANIERIIYYPGILNNFKNIEAQIIYAFGYEPDSILVNNITAVSYDDRTGVIAPNLYGIGIAFPEKYTSINGDTFSAIGVNSFIERAQELVPQWLKEAH